MKLQRNNIEERQDRVDAILADVRKAARPLPARIRRAVPGLGALVDHFRAIPITGRRLTQN